MPFKSESQRRLLWAKHPDIAERWAHEYPGQHDLPRHVGDPRQVRRTALLKAMKGHLAKESSR